MMILDKSGYRLLTIVAAVALLSLLANVALVLTEADPPAKDTSPLLEKIDLLEDRVLEARVESSYWRGFKSGVEYQKQEDMESLLEAVKNRRVPRGKRLKGEKTWAPRKKKVD